MTPGEYASFMAHGGMLDIHCLYKETRIHLFTPCLLPPQSVHPRAPAPKSQSFSFPADIPAMSGSGAQGKWMASSITEGNIQEPREVGYLAKEIAHRLTAKQQIVPTPEPNERVVFIPHFFRRLGFPFYPFVHGLMF